MLCPPCASVSPFDQKEAAWKGSRGGRTGSGFGQGRVRGTRKKKTQQGKKPLLSLCASVAASTRRASCHTCTLQALAGFGWTRCQVLQLEPLVLRCSRHGPVAEGWASPSRVATVSGNTLAECTGLSVCGLPPRASPHKWGNRRGQNIC